MKDLGMRSESLHSMTTNDTQADGMTTHKFYRWTPDGIYTYSTMTKAWRLAHISNTTWQLSL